MIFTIDNLLTPEQLTIISESLQTDDFIDGKTTAGWHARIVKENTQLSSKVTYAPQIKDSIKVALSKTHANLLRQWSQL